MTTPSQTKAFPIGSFLEHPARTTVAAVVSLLVARLFGLSEAYWATITTLVVMQSELGTTVTMANRRFLGTALGAFLGAGLVAWVGTNVWTYGAGVFVLGVVCAGLGRVNRGLRDNLDRTAYRYASIALAIVMLVAHKEAAWVVALHRFLEVSIGIAVALVMAMAWPERSSDTPAKSSGAAPLNVKRG